MLRKWNDKMKKTIVVMLSLISLNAFAVTKADCESQGKKFVDAVITKSGSYRKAGCRKAPVKLTDAQKSERIQAALKAHPGTRVSGRK